jgi:MFS family permease
MSRSALRWVVILTGIGLLMAALVTLAVATAWSEIRLDLGASVEQLEWTVNAYNLSFAVLLITGAALGDRFGRRRLFAVGLGLFAAASAAGALAPDVARRSRRAPCRAGAALIMPLGLALLSAAFPAEKRGAAIGLSTPSPDWPWRAVGSWAAPWWRESTGSGSSGSTSRSGWPPSRSR